MQYSYWLYTASAYSEPYSLATGSTVLVPIPSHTVSYWFYIASAYFEPYSLATCSTVLVHTQSHTV